MAARASAGTPERGFGGVRWGPRQSSARLINAMYGIYETAYSFLKF